MIYDKQMDKLTTSTSELPFNDLIRDRNQIRIPYYQRSYKWNTSQVKGLLQDIDAMLEGGIDREEIPAHFMGAIIVHQPQTANNQAAPVEVIDGQQRLTTIFLALLACIKVLADDPDHRSLAIQFIEDYVLLRQAQTEGRSNLKINVSQKDCEAMNSVVHSVVDNLTTDINKSRGFIPMKSTSKVKTNKVKTNFNILKKWTAKQLASNGPDYLIEIINVLLGNLTFVQINVKDPLSGPKIFDRLNSAGTPLSIAELVKNDVFGRIGVDDGNSFENFETGIWEPFYEKFLDEKWFQNYFFPFGLMDDPNIKKSDVYRTLQKKWNKNVLSPDQIIEDLSRFRDDYMSVCDGSQNECGHPEDLTAKFQRLRDLGQPTTTYPFLMRLSYEFRHNRENLEDVIETIDVLESFLVRRSVCGYEPSGLHAVFKRLWHDQYDLISDEKSSTLAQRVEKVIRGHKTVTWPIASEFSEKLKTRPMYGSGITRFLLLDYDFDLDSESPTDQELTVEHILPQSMGTKKCWRDNFDKDKHEELKDVLGNLTLLTMEVNSSADVSNSCFDVKKKAYSSKAMMGITREVAKSTNWTEVDIQKRSNKIAKWACKKWKY